MSSAAPSTISTQGLLQPADLELSDAQLDGLASDAMVWASQHGLVVGSPNDATGVTLVHAPIAALPVAFPQKQFMHAKSVQLLFNMMVDAVAKDEQYLEETLQAAARQDNFTQRLLDVLRSSRTRRASLATAGRPEVCLGIHRTDYMLDTPSQGFLQVELNTIASSFGCLSSQVTRMHRYVLSRLPPGMLDESRLPDNGALEGIPDAIHTAATAVAIAGGSTSASGSGGVVVMVVQPGERNAYDQQWIQLQLWERHRLRTLRRTLKQLSESGQVDEQDGTLTLQEGNESIKVLVVYFRAGYAPTDYPSEAEWAARAMIENSNAAKCPTVAYQLAGCKKVQQDLARPGMLERFMEGPSGSDQEGTSAADCAAMRTSFAGLWSLDDLRDPATAAIVLEAISNPEAFVLKPQREGGGNNLYGPELHSTLSSAMAALSATNGPIQNSSGPTSSMAPSTQPPTSTDDASQHGSPQSDQEAAGALSAYILMQRILPPPQRSILVRSGTWQRISTLSELGIYGVYCRVGSKVILNKEVGHLVRTKTATSNEGGVAAGFAVIDSPYLID